MTQFKNVFAFDLGSDYFRIYEKGILVHEVKSEYREKEVVYNKLITLGAIDDFRSCAMLLRAAMNVVQKPVWGLFRKSFDGFVIVSPGLSQVQRRAYSDLLEYLGAKRVFFLYDVHLIGVALRKNIAKENYTILELGAGKTIISTSAASKILQTETIDFSLLSMKNSVQHNLRKNHNINVSSDDLERLILEQLDFGNVNSTELKIRIEGHHKDSNEMMTARISNYELFEGVQPEIKVFEEKLRRYFESLNEKNELTNAKHDFYVVGKISQIKGIIDFIQNIKEQTPTSKELATKCHEIGMKTVFVDLERNPLLIQN